MDGVSVAQGVEVLREEGVACNEDTFELVR